MVQSDAEDFVWMTQKEIFREGRRLAVFDLPMRAGSLVAGVTFSCFGVRRLPGLRVLADQFMEDLGGRFSFRFPSHAFTRFRRKEAYMVNSCIKWAIKMHAENLI